ncbi:hypothetical protein ABZ819_34330 [Streptomyces venezuelae]|uniref:hypothetical protein n=1 Tax=Streptomyces venezuelae TaxID=54571 RepID=UPI003442B8DC
MTVMQVIVSVCSVLITGSVMTALAIWARRNMRADRAEDLVLAVDRERRERHAQRHAEDYKRAMELLDRVRLVAGEIRARPQPRVGLDRLGVPEIIKELAVLADKLEGPARVEIERHVLLHMGMVDSRPVPELDTMCSDVSLVTVVDAAAMQASNTADLLADLPDARRAIRDEWGPRDPEKP